MEEIIDENILKKMHITQMKILDEIVVICKKYNLKYYLTGGSMIGAVRHHGFIPWDDDIDIGMKRKDFEKFIRVASDELNKEKFYLDYYENGENKYSYLPFAKVKMKNTLYSEEVKANYKGGKEMWVDIFPFDYADDNFITRVKSTLVRFSCAMLCKKNKIERPLGKAMTLISKIIPKRVCFKLYDLAKCENNKKKYIASYASIYKIDKEIYPKYVFEETIEVDFEDRKYAIPKEYDYILKQLYGDYMSLPPVEKRVIHWPTKVIFENGEEIVLKNKGKGV